MNMVRRDTLNQSGPNQMGQRSAAQTPQRAGAPTAAQASQRNVSAAPTVQRPGSAAAVAPRPGMPQQPQPRMMAGGRPVSPTAKADELALVVRQLTELLTKENVALKKHKMEEVRALTERKEQLARLYQGHLNAVHKDKNVLAGLEPARRSAIAQAAMKLGQLMQDNASLLKANIDAINMFFGAVTEALKNRHDERSAAYSRSGSLGQYAVTKRSLAVSFNQTM